MEDNICIFKNSFHNYPLYFPLLFHFIVKLSLKHIEFEYEVLAK